MNSLILDILNQFFDFIRRHLGEICMAYAATMFSIFGNDIFKQIKKTAIGKMNFLIKLAVFVAVCSFGIAAMTSLLGRIMHKLLSDLDNITMLSVIAGLFLLAGFIAEQKKQV